MRSSSTRLKILSRKKHIQSQKRRNNRLSRKSTMKGGTRRRRKNRTRRQKISQQRKKNYRSMRGGSEGGRFADLGGRQYNMNDFDEDLYPLDKDEQGMSEMDRVRNLLQLGHPLTDNLLDQYNIRNPVHAATDRDRRQRLQQREATVADASEGGLDENVMTMAHYLQNHIFEGYRPETVQQFAENLIKGGIDAPYDFNKTPLSKLATMDIDWNERDSINIYNHRMSWAISMEKYLVREGMDHDIASRFAENLAINGILTKEVLNSMGIVDVPLWILSGPASMDSDTVPNGFICPITLVTMNDPVITADGQSYERTAIVSWLSSQETSPNTNLLLPNKTLIPNNNMKRVKEQWKESHPGR